MTNTTKTIVVPCDFTEIAQYAIDLANAVGKILGTDFTLVHIVDEGSLFTSENSRKKSLEVATQKLSEYADKCEKDFGKKPKIIVRLGNLYDTINTIAEELEARLVIMGIHEFKGLQKFTGSRALRVMAGSKVPYIMASAPYEFRPNNDIVFPVDHKVENKEKLVWANYMAGNFKSKIHIFSANHSDELLRKRTLANLNFARKYMTEKGIDYEIHTAEKGKNFTEEIIRFSKEVNTNLILIMITKEISLQDYLLGAEEQKIIFNDAKISVMCVNPRTDLRKSGGFN